MKGYDVHNLYLMVHKNIILRKQKRTNDRVSEVKIFIINEFG